MIELFDKQSGKKLGRISEEQLNFLIDQLEEETEEDVDYYINKPTLEMFKDRDIDPALLQLLEKGLGSREEMEIEWRED
ncbi:MAG: galactosyldiacylglycerol synthase [Candidatus Eisenbacteria bacterium]|nr:galactosyldiacylglycerol synthase [Candidatus Eisenbacteria bacterium]